MDYQVLDWATYARKDHFLYFASMANPYAGTTVEVDITDFLARCKAEGYPFFLSFLYCVGRAANAVPQLRQRIVDGRPVELRSCNTSHTVLRPDGTYGYCRLDCMQPFDAFLPEAIRRHEAAKVSGNIEDGDEGWTLLFTSSTPWLRYTGLVQPTPVPADSNPRITWGKYLTENGRTTMPVSLLVNHALVDGLHIGEFYRELDGEMRAFPG